MSVRGRGGLPRPLEAAAAGAGLVALAPLLLLAAGAVALSSPGPVLFRQPRMGRGGQPFTLYKFRSMRVGGGGPQVTASGDRRVTAVGQVLRRTKIDELPELWNVVRGDMALVGPRPEVPAYVDLEDPRWRRVLAVRPGLTDPVTLELRNEEELLRRVGAGDAEFYVRELLPYKLRGYLAYLERRTAWSDLGVLWRTALGIVWPRRTAPPSREQIRAGSNSADPSAAPGDREL